jgi:hypothetical protein
MHGLICRLIVWALAIIGLLGVLAWQRLRDPEPSLRTRKGKSRFRAVRVVPAANACAAARRASQQRVLLTAAPRLPLEACDRIMRCRCRFKHYGDRRCGDDRRAMFAALGGDTAQGPVNRRSGVERRRYPPTRLDTGH